MRKPVRGKAERSPEALRQELETHQEELVVQHQQLREAQAELEASRDAYAELYDFAPIPYFTLDLSGLIQAVNLTGCTLLGRHRTSLLGMPFYPFVVSEDGPKFLEHMRRCRSGQPDAQAELRIRAPGGREIPMLIQSKVIGGQSACRTVLFDLTECKVAEARFHELNATLEQRVRERTAELETANEILLREIQQREIAEQALLDADQRKDQFLAMLGHELRNPLAPIRHAAAVLKIAAPQDPCLQELREVIERQTGHMSHIIDDLLDVSRISRGKINLQFESVDWGALVQAEAHDFGVELLNDGLALQVEVPDEPVWVNGDSTRLTQILGNLLHNAQKFTDRGGTISVRLQIEDSRHEATLTVSDTGIGIEPEVVATIFETFSQADKSLDRTRGGLGLGLALVKGLVELHGGRVAAASGGLGKGTSISIALPLQASPAIPPRDIEQQRDPRRRRILVVDDRRDQVRMMAALLTRLGHEVYTASSGAEALQILQDLNPDVVFSDIGMPDIDGYEVARRIRSKPAFQNALLIAVTGYGQPEDERRAYEAGFDRHLRKPLGLQELQTLLSQP